MSKKEEFKEFVKNKPELVSYIKNGDMTWQKFYEIYDIYGDNREVWQNYSGIKNSSTTNFSSITDMVKNIDMDSIQKHINTAQKALGIVQELTGKGAATEAITKGPITPRPLNKFFED